mgnify:CR=1 FL=1
MKNKLLNYIREGQGEPLIIIHGLFGSARNWKGLSKIFSQQFEVFTLDLRNHGESFHHDLMSYQVMAEDVYNFMQEMGISSAHILGHSMGGKVAMKLNHHYPECIRKLVVADIAPVTYQHDYDEIIKAVFALDLSHVASRKSADIALTAGIPDQRIRLFLLQNLSFDKEVPYWKLNWVSIKNHMDLITGFEDVTGWSIENESLFIRGELSDYVTQDIWVLIQQHFKNARLQTLDSAGHWLHAEQPKAFSNAVLSFLS